MCKAVKNKGFRIVTFGLEKIAKDFKNCYTSEKPYSLIILKFWVTEILGNLCYIMLNPASPRTLMPLLAAPEPLTAISFPVLGDCHFLALSTQIYACWALMVVRSALTLTAADSRYPTAFC